MQIAGTTAKQHKHIATHQRGQKTKAGVVSAWTKQNQERKGTALMKCKVIKQAKIEIAKNNTLKMKKWITKSPL